MCLVKVGLMVDPDYVNGKLFDLLIKRNLPACIIRVLLNLYTYNLLRVRWNGVDTDYFSAVNGVMQCAV